MRLSNETYDILKWVTTIVLPAIGTLYFALSGIWGFPYGEQIVGTITALVTFFGVILGISNNEYKKMDAMYVEEPEDSEVIEDDNVL